MDTPKPVLPINNFNYQPLGLRGLVTNQTFYSATGSMPTQGAPAANNPLGLSSDYLNKINQITAPTTGIQSPYEQAKKYDRVSLGYDVNRDNEDFYAQNQSAFEQIGAGLGRLALTTGTKLASGLSYLGGAVTGLVTAGFQPGSFGENWLATTADNAFVNFFNGLEEDVKTDLFPVFQDAADRNKGFFSRALTDLNFWTDEAVDGAAFMLSSLLPGAALGKLGLGAKAVRGLAGAADKAEDAAKILQGLKQVGIQGFDEVGKVQQITKLMSNAKLARSIDLGASAVTNTAIESLVEAAEVKKQMTESLTGKINPETGDYYTPQEIRERAAGAAMNTFGMNMAALMVSNLWEANLFFKKLPGSGSTGAVSFGEELLGKATAKSSSLGKKIGKNVGSGILAEGIWEENAQLAISRFNSSKYGGEETKYNTLIGQYVGQLKDAFEGKDQEAAMSIGLGGILGGIVGGVMQTKSDIREEKALTGKVDSYNNIVDSFKGLKDIYQYEEVTTKNEAGEDVTTRKIKLNEKGLPLFDPTKLTNFLSGFKELADLMKIAEKAEASKNSTMVNMVRNELISKFALAHFELGEANVLKEKLENITNLPEEDLTMLGFDPTSKIDGASTQKELIRRVNELEELYNSIQENVMDSDVSEAKKRKLFDLGSRQQILIAEYNRTQAIAASLEKAPGITAEANKLIAAENAAKTRYDGLLRMAEEDTLDNPINIDTIDSARKDYEKAIATREKFEKENAEALKEGKLGPLNYYAGVNSNAIADAKRNAELEKAAGLQYALVDTTNIFNRVADLRNGDGYFKKQFILKNVIEEFFKDKTRTIVDDYSAEDKNYLNERLTTLSKAEKYDELTDLYPSLVDINTPVNKKLSMLENLAVKNPLAKELYEAFLEDVKEFMDVVKAKEAERVAKEEELKKVEADKEKNDKLQAEFSEVTKTNGEVSTAEAASPTVAEKENKEAKKTIQNFYNSTVTNERDNSANPTGFHNRHQVFMNKSNSHPKRKDFRIILVTAKNEKALGVEGITKAIYNGVDVEIKEGAEPIVALYVLRDSDGRYYPVDMNGNKLGPAITEGGIDLEKAVFSFLPSTNPKHESGEYRFVDPKNEPLVAAYQEAYTKKRKEILENPEDELMVYEYKNSRGFPKVTTTERGGVKIYESNPIIGTLVSESDIEENTGIIKVSTNGQVVHNGETISVPPGRVVLSHGSTFVYLQNRNLTDQEAQNIYEVLKYFAKEVEGNKGFKSKEATAIINYLQNMIFFGSPYGNPQKTEEKDKRVKNTASNQVYFREGKLFFGRPGNKEEFVPFTETGIEQNKDAILGILKSMYNNVNSATLNKDADFLEVSVNPDGTLNIKKWPSYRMFLVSDKNLDGSPKKPMLSTITRTVDKNNPFDRNMGGIYSTLNGLLNNDTIEKSVPQEKAKAKSYPKKEVTEPKTQRVKKGEVIAKVNTTLVKYDLYEDDIEITGFFNEDGSEKQMPDTQKAKEAVYPILMEKEFPGLLAKRKAEEELEAANSLVGEPGTADDAEVLVLSVGPVNAETGNPPMAAVSFDRNGYLIMKLTSSTGADVELDSLPPAIKESVTYIVEASYNNYRVANGLPKIDIHVPEVFKQAQQNKPIPGAKPEQAAESTAEEKMGEVIQQTPPPPVATPDTSEIERLRAERAAAKAKFDKMDDEADEELYSIVDASTGYIIGNMQKEIADIAKMVDVPATTVANLIRTTNGGWAWGRFKGRAIELWEKAKEGTGYHEAFEAIWKLYLTPGEKVRALKEFRNRVGSFIDRTSGQTIKFSEAIDFQAKEALADEFAANVLRGELKAPRKGSAIGDFFRGLWNWIMSFITGRSYTIEQIFEKTKSGRYKKIGPIFDGNEQEEYSIGDLNETDSYHIIRAIANRVIGQFMKENGNLSDISQIEGQVGDIFERVKVSIEKYYNNRMNRMEQEGFAEEDILKLQKVVSNINDNWNKVTTLTIQYLKIFNIVTVSEEDNTQYKESIENTASKDEAYLLDHFTYDGKTNAPAAIKLLFATLTEHVFKASTNPDALPEIRPVRHFETQIEKAVDFGGTFNRALQETSVGNTVEEKMAIIREVARINPNFVQLARRLKLEASMDSLQTHEWDLLAKLNATMSRYKPSPIIQYIDMDEEGNKISYTGSADLESGRRSVVSGWIDDLKAMVKDKDSIFDFVDGNYTIRKAYDANNKPVMVDGRHVNVLYNEPINTKADKLKFLKLLGINIDVKSLNKLPSGEQERLQDAIVSVANKLKESNIVANSVKAIGIEGPMNVIAEVVAMTEQIDYESTYFNINGKKVQKYILRNEFATIVNDINRSETLEELKQRLPHLNNRFSAASYNLIDRLYNKEGRKKKDKYGKPIQLQLKYIQGTIDNTDDYGTKPTDQLNEADRMMQEINQNLQDNYYILVPGDSQTEHMLELKSFMSYGELADISEFIKKFTKVLNDYYRVEKQLFEQDGKKRIFHVLSENYQDADVKNKAHEYVNNITYKTIDFLLQYGVIIKNGDNTYRMNSLDDQFARKNNINKKAMSRDELFQLIMLRNINYIIANTEMAKLFIGDIAQVKNFLKRVKSYSSPRTSALYGSESFNNHANANRNTAFVDIKNEQTGEVTRKEYRLTSPLQGRWQFKDHMKTATKASVIVSNDLYDEIDATDAQAWACLPGYREYNIRFGTWDNAQEQQYQYLMALDRKAMYEDGHLNSSEYPAELRQLDDQIIAAGPVENIYFQPTKPIVSGFDNDQNNPLLDKDSIVPLTYHSTRGRAISQEYVKMIKEGISYIIVDTGRKVGVKQTDNFYNEDGSYNTNPYNPESIVNVPFKYFGNQVENTSKKSSNTRGSQVTAMVMFNTMEGGIPIDFRTDIKAFDIRALEWARLTEQQKEEQSPIYRENMHNIRLLREMTALGYEKLLKKLGIVDNGQEYVDENTFEVMDLQKLKHILREELSRREVSNNILDALEIDEETGEFKIPLEAMNNYGQIKNVIFSYVDKFIASPKLNGGPKVQVSGAGWEIGGREVKAVKNKKGQTIYVSSGLKFYEKGENKISRMQVLLPYSFGNRIKKHLNFKTDEELFEYFKNHPDTSEILSGIGFRIPTQEMNSIESFEIAGFLPEWMGDTIVVPEAITKKSGSDFDIDKLNTYIKNLYIDINGNVKLVPYFDNREEADKHFSELFDYLKSGYKKKLTEFREAVKGLVKGSNKYLELYRKYDDEISFFMEGIVSKEDMKKALEELDTDYERIMQQLQDEKEHYIRKMYGQSLENAYFQSMDRIVTRLGNFERLTRPNNSDTLTGLRDVLVGISQEEFGAGATESIIDPNFMSRKRHFFILGKQGVGIAAVSQKFSAVAQLTNIYLKSISEVPTNAPMRNYLGNLEINLPHNKTVDPNGRIKPSFSGIYSKSGQFISDIKSEFINGYVDITADEFIIQIGASKNVASIYLDLVGLGVDPKIVVMFMNQPIIREYLKSMAIDGTTWLFNDDRINDIKKQFSNSNRIKPVPLRDVREPNALYEELYGMVKNFYSAPASDSAARYEGLTSDEKGKQLTILDDFIRYAAISQNMFALTQGTNYDTASFTAPEALLYKDVKKVKADNTAISSADSLMNTYIGGVISKYLGRATSAVNTFFKTHAPNVLEAFLPIQVDLAERLNNNDYMMNAPKVEQTFINSLVMIKTRLNNKIHELLINQNTSLATRLVEIKKIEDASFSNNLVLTKLYSSIEGNNIATSTKNVRLSEKAVDVVTSNAYTEALRELRDNPTTKELYGMILRVAFIQSGVAKSKISMTEIIPVEDYKNFIVPVLNSLTDDELLHTFMETDAFYRINWFNSTIVPTVKHKDIQYSAQYQVKNFFPGGPVRDHIMASIPESDTAARKNAADYKIYKVWPGSKAAKSRFIRVSYFDKLIPKAERDRMRARGDYSYKKTYFLQRLDAPDGTPYLFGPSGKEQIYYFPTYAWGDNYRGMEFYDTIRPSQYANGVYVPNAVFTNEEVYALLQSAGLGSKKTDASTPAQVVSPTTIPSTTPIPTKKVISGLQTGVDTIGLEAANMLGIETGGTATPGFATELGGNAKELAAKYNVTEIDRAKQAKARNAKEFYLPRTEENVINSDGTVYFASNTNSAGRIATENFTKQHKKPFLLNPNPEQLRVWLIQNNIQTLNVAGNRGSKLTAQQADNIRNILLQALSNPKPVNPQTQSNQDTQDKIDECLGG